MVAEKAFAVSLPVEEFDFVRTVTSGQTFRWHEIEPGIWSGVDGANYYRVELSGSIIQVESNASKADFEELFRLNVELREVSETIRKGAGVMLNSACLGLRQIRASDPEETFFCFLCTPNNNLPRIQSMVRKLGQFGKEIPGAPGLRRFPSADVIAQIDESELRSLGFGYRAKSIPKAAKALLDRGTGWLNHLKSGTYTEAFNEMLWIPGIGPKLADCILLYGLHFDEAVPIDTHLWQAAKRHRLVETDWATLTDKRYRDIGSEFRTRFGKWAGWVQLLFYYDNMQIQRTSVKGR